MQGSLSAQGSTIKTTGMGALGKAGGRLLVVVGLVGFVLPVIPGIPLLLEGLGLLACEYVRAKRLLERVKGGGEQVRPRKE